jgi:hypothetical protein
VSAESAGQAAFNPFGTIGVVTVQAPTPAASTPAASQPVQADWGLPVTTALVGFAFIGWILRGIVR